MSQLQNHQQANTSKKEEDDNAVITSTKTIQHHRRIGSIIDEDCDDYYGLPVHPCKSNNDDHVTEVMTGLAKACNNLVLDNFGLCTIYCDQQLQYELDQYNKNEVGTAEEVNTFSQNAISPFVDYHDNEVTYDDDDDSFRRL